MWSVSSTSARLLGTSAAGASTLPGALDARTAVQSVNALFERADVRSPNWEASALAVFRSIREAGVALDGVVAADQLRTLAQSDCRKLVSFLVRFDATKTMALRLRAFSPGPEIERAIRKGEGRPYLSSHGDAAIRLNAIARYPRQRTQPLVVCDDLSRMYLVSAQDSPSGRKPEWEQFKTVESIVTHAGSPDVERAMGRIESATSRHILTNSEFGSFLTGRFKELKERFERLSGDQAREGVASHFKIETMRHAMALTLTVKQGEDGPEFVARLYDPNFTATHIRACTLQPASFAAHCMSDYLAEEITGVDNVFGRYVRGDDVQGKEAILEIRDADLRDREPQEPVCHVSANIRPGATFAFHLLNAGATEAFEQMWRAVQANAAATSDTFTLLRAWSEGIKTPGAFRAFYEGHAEIIGAFTKAVLESGLPKHQIVELLAAPSLAVPGLSIASQHGHAEAASTFLRSILDSSLPNEDKLRLIGAKRPTGETALGLALIIGRAEVVKAFVDAILASGLSTHHKVDLLSATMHEGSHGLLAAMQDGHAETVKVFLDAVLASNLSAPEKMALLAPKTKTGDPALSKALLNDWAPVVRVFAEAVLNSDLPEDSKLELLAAKYRQSDLNVALARAFGSSEADLPPDTPGLVKAFWVGSTGAARAFVEAVLASGLPDDAKVDLVAARGRDGVHGVAIAFAKGHAQTARAVAEAVLDSGLPMEQKFELLAARDAEGTPVLLDSIRSGRAEAATTFVEVVANSSLPDDHKRDLLLARDAHGSPALPSALAHGHLEAARAEGIRATFSQWALDVTKAAVAYVQAIGNAGLPEELRRQLLTGMNPDGRRQVLDGLLQGEDRDALEAYIGLVLNAHLPDTTTVRFLSPTGNLQAAPRANVAAFEDAIGRSRLPLPQRRQVADAFTRCGLTCNIL